MSLSRKVPSFQDLTAYEKSIVDELKRRTFHDLTPKMQEDETLFYRFCKARDYDLEEAEIMLRKHIAWVKETKIETFLTSYKPQEVLSKYYPCGSICHDKEGSVVTYFDFGNLDMKALWNCIKPSDGLKIALLNVEQDFMELERQNKKLGTTLTKIGYIYNLDNLSFSNAVHKKTIELFLEFYKIYLDNYPERMKYVYIINVIEKLKFYGSSGWKEDLLKIIDADELPAFLGGNKTDPDGNPLCKTFVRHGQQVPESYYFNNRKKLLSSSSHLKKLTVQRSSMEEMRFNVTERGSLLEWEFELKNRDIDFVVYFNFSGEESKLVKIVPKQRMDTYYGPEKNYVKCENPGIYTIVFDNSYSWVHSKEVFYRIRVRKSNE